ncbi:MAG: hypothetical protein H6719_21295 [Sandaracinaceae bacterium]|nr:hypothetical protein [Sandaracinaceae bacterium]
MKTYEEKLAEIEVALREHDSAEPPDSDLLSQAQSDRETIIGHNAQILSNRWGGTASVEVVGRAIAAVGALLRSALLHSEGGVEAEGSIEELDSEPHFEVTVGPGSVIRLPENRKDPRVRIAATEIARDLALQLGIEPSDALGLWARIATACREWAETPEATPLLPHLSLRVGERGVTVRLEQSDYGLG